jgi:hypothetical protein
MVMSDHCEHIRIVRKLEVAVMVDEHEGGSKNHET